MLYLGFYHPAKGNGTSPLLSSTRGTELGPYYLSRGSSSYRSIVYRVNQERTQMLYPDLFDISQGSATRTLLSIPREQISTLYLCLYHTSRADINALPRPFSSSRGERNQALTISQLSRGSRSQRSMHLLSIPREQVLM